MSGVVRIEIVETPQELKDLMHQKKDAVRQEKLLVLYWLKTQMVDSVLSAAARRTENIVPQYKLNVILLFGPAYSPEVNPIERLWGYLKEQLKWLRFDNIEELRAAVQK